MIVMDRLSTREQFRLSGRKVLRTPQSPAAHGARIGVAVQLEVSEPIQAAFVDMLYACDPAKVRSLPLLKHPKIRQRLGNGIADNLQQVIESGKRLPRVTPLATRYCILATPSLDVPSRAMLCGPDDSRQLADHALPALLAGDTAAEAAFLDHCEGSLDSLAFLKARRVLVREGHPLSDRWRQVADLLEQGARV